MLVEIKKLHIINEGYNRKIFLDKIYINSDKIVSITDYEGAENFLLTEQSKFSNQKFSLVRVGYGDKTEDIIAFGSAEQIFSSLQNKAGKQVLHD